MATVTTKRGSVTFVLELDEAEAEYVYAALHNSHPKYLDGDAPWYALHDTFQEEGITPRDDAAL